MITITEKSRAAVRALTELAARADAAPVPILEVSERRGVPLHLLEQLFSGLRRAGVLQSQRGVKGGYSFQRDPAEVTLLEVVEIVDGRLGWTQDAMSGCDQVWQEAKGRLASLLADLTVADMVDLESRTTRAPMFHI
ncbi:MAG: Rrf2 family transcriptional regulator [Thermoleophilia bacterium]